MDHLEKYLKKHRTDLDRMEPVPADEMWKRISATLPAAETDPVTRNTVTPMRKPDRWKRIAVAASILAVAGWSLWLFQPKEEPFSLASVAPEMAAEEIRLQQFIAAREKEINLSQIDRSLYEEIFHELEEIDRNAQQARNDIQAFPENHRPIETLIRQYELKIRILEMLAKEIQKEEYHEELEKNS